MEKVCRHYRHPLVRVPRRASLFHRKDRLLHVYSGFRGNRHKRTRAIFGIHNPGHEVLHSVTWVLVICGRSYNRVCVDYHMGCAQVWTEKHAGLHQCLFVNWRVECSRDPGIGCRSSHTDFGDTTVQSVVSLRAVCVYCGDFGCGDYLP